MRLPMNLLGSLWISKTPYETLWLPKNIYSSLWMTRSATWNKMSGRYPDPNFWLPINHYGSLWISMRLPMNLLGSLWISRTPYETLWLPMNIYGFQWISLAPFESLWLPINLHSFLWISMAHGHPECCEDSQQFQGWCSVDQGGSNDCQNWSQTHLQSVYKELCGTRWKVGKDRDSHHQGAWDVWQTIPWVQDRKHSGGTQPGERVIVIRTHGRRRMGPILQP